MMVAEFDDVDAHGFGWYVYPPAAPRLRVGDVAWVAPRERRLPRARVVIVGLDGSHALVVRADATASAAPAAAAAAATAVVSGCLQMPQNRSRWSAGPK